MTYTFARKAFFFGNQKQFFPNISGHIVGHLGFSLTYKSDKTLTSLLFGWKLGKTCNILGSILDANVFVLWLKIFSINLYSHN